MKKMSSYFYRPPKRDSDIAKKKWNIIAILKKAVARTCMVIGAMVLLSSLLTAFLIGSAGQGAAPKPLPKDMILVFDLEDGLTEVPTRPTLFDPFPFSHPTVRGVVTALSHAAEDDRVRGIIFRLNGAGLSIAHVQEVREAVLKFRQSGKFAKIYAPSYIDGSGGLTQYFLAAAFDEIWMQPVGMLSISGPSLKMPFAKSALEKIGISADFLTREEYKSAMENFTRSDISPANNEMLESLIGNLAAQMMSYAAADREMDVVSFAMALDQGLLSGAEARDQGLIDRLDYPDVLISEIRKAVKGDAEDQSLELIDLSQYSAEMREPKASAKNKSGDVALIYIVGTIMDVSDNPNDVIGSEIAADIMDAAEDEEIEAIVLRIDSPGGSPSASETIRRAVIRAKEKGKRIIVSMGSVAASGGYWIAVDADRIVATPGTLTGSIGVVMGKFEASGLWEKTGIQWQGPQMGENADLWSIHKPFDANERVRMNALIDETYEAFLTRVAEGRKMSKDAVRTIAKGRAWTGEQASLNGLVDVMGGLETAFAETAKLLEIEDPQHLNIRKFPRDGNPLEQLLELFGQQVSAGPYALSQAEFLMTEIHPLMTQARLIQSSPVLVYDPVLWMMAQ